MTYAKPVYRAPRRSAASQEQSYYYVFNADGGQGFVIVSGDDRTEQILGYSDQGAFDAAQLPEPVANFLQSYADQIKHLDDIGYTVAPERLKAPKQYNTRHAVAPLLKCRWGQGWPYNTHCPLYDGQNRAVAGCSAISLGQVMSFFKWPKQLKNDIQPYTDGKGNHHEGMPAGTTFDWDNIKDYYDGNATQEEVDAVGKFVYAVGTMLQSSFGASTGASTTGHAEDLVKIFDYDDGVWTARRANYSIEEWAELFYQEVAAGRPVCYTGRSTGGGHAFALDGYDGEGLYHINWGWNGACDGYYRLEVLAPGADAGTGASLTTDGYVLTNNAYLSLHAPDEYSAIKQTTLNLTTSARTLDDETKTLGVKYTNGTGRQYVFDMSAAIIDEDGNLVPFGEVKTQNLAKSAAVTQQFSLASLPAGTYKVVPVSKRDFDVDWQCDIINLHQYFEVTVAEDGSVTSQLKPSENLTVEELTFRSSLKVNDNQEVEVAFKNTGDECYQTIGIYASKTDDMGKCVTRRQLIMRPGETTRMTFYFTPNESGIWNVWIANYSNTKIVYAKTDVEIKEYGALPVNPCNLECPTAFGVSNVSNGMIVGNCIYGKLLVKNNGENDYEGALSFQRWRRVEGESVAWSNGRTTVPVFIPAGESKVVDLVSGGLIENTLYSFRVDYTYGSRSIRIRERDAQMKITSGSLAFSNNGTISGISSASTSFSVGPTVSAINFSSVNSYPKLSLGRANKNCVFAFAEGATVPTTLSGRNVIVGNTAENITLQDGSSFYAPCNFTAKHISYSRVFKRAAVEDAEGNVSRWETIVLPFTPSRIMVDGNNVSFKRGDFYLKAFSHLDESGKPCFKKATTMEAGIPYLIAVPESLVGKTFVFEAENAPIQSMVDSRTQISSSDYVFVGTMIKATASKILVLNDEGNTFVSAEGDTDIEPFRAYFRSVRKNTADIAVSNEDATDEEDEIRVLEGELLDLSPARDVALRAPAVPLFVGGTGMQLWSTADQLNQSAATTGMAAQGWEAMKDGRINGYVRVDGKPYQFMGTSMKEEGMKSKLGKMKVLIPADAYGGSYDAQCLRFLSESAYGTPASENNGNYNKIVGTPEESDGKQWFEPGYDTSAWETLHSPLNTTSWMEKSNKFGDIYVVRTFTTTDQRLATCPVYLACGHDDGPAEWYINGTKVFTATDGWNTTETYMLTDEQKALIKTDGSENVLAYHVHQNWGGCYADGGLYMTTDAQDILRAGQWDGCTYTVANTDPENWNSNDNDNADWNEGHYGPFVAEAVDGQAGTVWESAEEGNLYVRRTFDLRRGEIEGYGKLTLRLAASGNVVVYVNGKWLTERTIGRTGITDFETIPLDRSMLIEGRNVIAVKAAKGTEQPFLDFALVGIPEMHLNDVEMAEQKGNAKVLASQSHYQFAAGPVDLDLTFTSDSSSPVISYEVTANDGCDHDVQVFFTMRPEDFMPTDEPINYELTEQEDMKQVRAGELCLAGKATDHQRVGFTQNPDWYVVMGETPMQLSGTAMSYTEDHPVLIYSDNLYTIIAGTSLQGYVVMNGNPAASCAEDIENYKQNIESARTLDEQIYDDACAVGGEKYAEVASLAYRQTMAAATAGEVDAATLLDVTPLLAIYHPEQLENLYASFLKEQQDDDSGNDNDTDNAYDDADGNAQLDTLSNVLLSAATAIRIQERSAEDIAPERLQQLKDFATRLSQSIDQTTDEHLKAKGIVALAAFAQVARIAEDAETAKTFGSEAQAKAEAWTTRNADGDHYRQTDEQEWGVKYALAYDKILGTHLFDDVATTELAYYKEKANQYGLPLDGSTTVGSLGYTYAVAALADETEDWMQLTAPLWDCVNTTTSRMPLYAFYDTVDATGHNADNLSSTGWMWLKVLAGKMPQVPNGIETINSLTPDSSLKGEGSKYVYDLQGRKVADYSSSKKGIYIKNNKKIIVK